MRVLVACEYSGCVRDAFTARGHEATSCDLLETDRPDQVIQPWMFGHYETKATCLWLWGVDSLRPTYRTPDECREALGIPAGTKPEARIHKMPDCADRWKLRSMTFPGIAQAMADQWGKA
jgi:hypothetical protein